jgi:tetratricopeptide (TPR) repeat protein
LLKARSLEFAYGEGAPQSRKLFEEVIEYDPQSSEARLEYGMYWFRLAGTEQENMKLWARAEEQFRAAFKADGTNGVAILHAGFAKAWQKGPNEELTADFVKAAELMPGNDLPLLQILKYSDDAPLAIEGLLLERPESRQLERYYALALVERGGKDLGRGLAFVDQARDKSQDDPLAHYNRFRVMDAAGIHDEACKSGEQAVRLTKGALDREVYDQVDRFAVRNEHLSLEQRNRLWKAFLETHPDEVNALNNAAVFMQRSKDYEKSAEWYELAIKAAPDDPELLKDTGLIYQDPAFLNAPKRGEPYFWRAIQAAQKRGINHPDHSLGYKNAVDTLVRMMIKQNRHDEVLKFAEDYLHQCYEDENGVLVDDPRYGAVKITAENR